MPTIGEQTNDSRIHYYWIYAANNCQFWNVHFVIYIYICIGYILPIIWEIYVSWIYVFIGIRYILPTIGGLCQLKGV